MKKTEKIVQEKIIKPNLFDLDYIDDLPEKLKVEVLNNPVKLTQTTCILKLFDYKAQLSTSEIMTGLYRAYGIEKTRTIVQATVNVLLRKKKILKNPDGAYELMDYSLTSINEHVA